MPHINLTLRLVTEQGYEIEGGIYQVDLSYEPADVIPETDPEIGEVVLSTLTNYGNAENLVEGESFPGNCQRVYDKIEADARVAIVTELTRLANENHPGLVGYTFS